MSLRNYKSKLIVLEGTDWSGKETQTRLLLRRIKKEGWRAAALSFPRYGKLSAGLVEGYLKGAFGNPENINPYAASLFYALDRFAALPEIKKLLRQNDAVIFDRYVDSSAGHQGGKIKNSAERKKFLSWLYDLEYDILGLPRPDRVLILHIPAQGAHALIRGRRDRHERNILHLRNAEASYLWLAGEHPKTHRIIECQKDGILASPREIHEKIWDAAKKLL